MSGMDLDDGEEWDQGFVFPPTVHINTGDTPPPPYPGTDDNIDMAEAAEQEDDGLSNSDDQLLGTMSAGGEPSAQVPPDVAVHVDPVDDIRQIAAALDNLAENFREACFPRLTQQNIAIPNQPKDSAQAHTVPYMSGACGLEAAYYIARQYKAGLRECDTTPDPSHAGGHAAIVTAMTATESSEINRAYRHMVDLLQKEHGVITNDSEGRGMADAMDCWDLIAAPFRQFCFTTCTIRICPCNNSAGPPTRRTHISITKGFFDVVAQPQIRTIGDVCKAFFASYLTYTECPECGRMQTRKEVLLDRLPLHLMVEWPTGQGIEGEIDAWDLDAPTAEINFRYTRTLPTRQPYRASASIDKVKALISAGRAGHAHIVAFLTPGGLDKDAVIKDSISHPRGARALMPQQLKEEHRVLAGVLLRCNVRDN